MRQPAGGVTREMLRNSRKTTSPAIAAGERVQEAVSQVGSMPAKEGIALLEQRIGEARAAGVRDDAPNLKKAVALLATLQPQAGAGAVNTKKTDPQKAAFDALFDGGYAMPDLDELDL